MMFGRLGVFKCTFDLTNFQLMTGLSGYNSIISQEASLVCELA